jgi:hypothetical protein
MYQAYLLGYNDASLVGHCITTGREPCAGGRLSAEAGYDPFIDVEPLPDWLQRARDSISVNTLTVLGASTRASLADIAGVDADRIRVLRTQSQRKVGRLGRKRWKHYKREARRQLRQKAESGGDAGNPAASPLSPGAES